MKTLTTFAALLAATYGLIAASANAEPSSDAQGQSSGDNLQELVVTGSRVITNGNGSPTPLTLVTAEQLTATTPSNLADALNNLPAFSGSTGPQSARQSTLDNTAGNFLNLRGLGSVRNLILFDGLRVPPTSSAGTVDVDSLPQMLVQRVDVVTGGASAVYGSDAISGVVNFVLDHHFNGIKVDASSGISNEHDDKSKKFGMSVGTDFAAASGHFEASFEHYSSDGIPNMFDRPAGREIYTVAGAGTAASPFHTVTDGTLFWATNGGYFIPSVPGPLSGMTFTNNNGSLARAIPSDLAYVQSATMLASLKTDQGFARLDFDLTDWLHFYSQANFTASANEYQLSPMLYVFDWILPNNAYLPTSAQAALSGPGGGPVLFGKDSLTNPGFIGDAHGHNVFANLGVSGNLWDKASFDLAYIHGESRQLTKTLNNINALRLAAALDAEVDPATGKIVCGSTLTHPGAFPGCVPLNPFGPTSETPTMLQYVEQNTLADVVNKNDEVSGNLVGDVFSTWAGSARTSLSVELRHQSLEVTGDGTAVAPQECAGLTLATLTCPSTRFTSPASGDAYGSESVREIALETNIPLLKDAVGVKSLDLNGAFRNAHYSTSGNANIWKVGLVWSMTDELTVRGTRSRDFRAPTLTDLFGPVSTQHSGFTDLHTMVNGITDIQTSGNPDLKPEVGLTSTIGLVYRPQWIDNFSATIDFYDISISNAIGQFSGGDPAVQQQCEASNGTSPACNLFVRPFPFSNHTAANFPTLVSVEELNLSKQIVRGLDTDLNYAHRIGGGRFTLRNLVSFQPTNDTQLYPGAPIVHGAGTATGVDTSGAASVASGAAGLPKWRVTNFASYEIGSFGADVQTRWRSALKQTNNSAVSSDPDVPAVTFTDLTLSYMVPISSKAELKTFFTVQNLFDKMAPIWQQTGSANAPGYFYPAVNGDDIVGRYFTLGVRARFQ